MRSATEPVAIHAHRYQNESHSERSRAREPTQRRRTSLCRLHVVSATGIRRRTLEALRSGFQRTAVRRRQAALLGAHGSGIDLSLAADLVLPQRDVVEAPWAAAGEDHEEENEAVQNCGVPAVYCREEGTWEMRQEIGNSHVAGENKGD